MPAQTVSLRLPQALIIRANQPEADINLRSYRVTFEALGLQPRTAAPAVLAEALQPAGLVLCIPARTARELDAAQVERALALIDAGATLVTEEINPLSEGLGFRAGATVETQRVVEADYPDMMIVWERPGGVVTLQPPPGAAVLTREKWSNAALAAVTHKGRGRALALATELDPHQGDGYARFPYFAQALRHAGVTFPFRSERLHALMDTAYRLSADLDYLGRRWRRAGISVVHISAWHYWEPNRERDDYLKRLIEASHRNGILVYAWLELPHVSPAFWDAHPEWREKTAAGQDAHLDWRSLMNLKNPACFAAVADGLQALLRRFDWDGVNLSELYFESPQGPSNPQRFTPFNSNVRAEFKARHGVDPVEFFREKSQYFWKASSREWQKFVDYRVEQVRLLHERFLKLLVDYRSAAARPDLGLAITFVDNVYDTKMREAIGADITEMLALMDRYDFTLIMEDPGTVWHMGPRRYSDLAQSYSKLTRRTDRLGIDINVVERWQDVYPTKKQSGGEFLQLFHLAGRNFRTVMVYFEHSMLTQDQELVAHALAAGVQAETAGEGLRIQSALPLVYRSGMDGVDFSVNGKLWPAATGGDVLLPAGKHTVTAATAGATRPRLVKLNGELLDAGYDGDGLVFSYRAATRAIAIFDRAATAVEVDGRVASPGETVLLPAGVHRVKATW